MMKSNTAFLLLTLALNASSVHAWSPSINPTRSSSITQRRTNRIPTTFSHNGASFSSFALYSSNANSEISVAPTFNGKMVFPMKALMTGLEGHTVAAVYAVLNKNYKRGSNGNEWEYCEHIGYTKDLNADLQSHLTKYDSSRIAHIRALSFAYPQKTAMEEVATRWKEQALQAGGNAVWDESDDYQVVEKEEDASSDEEVEEKKKMLVEIIDATADYYEDDDDEDDEFEFDDDGGVSLINNKDEENNDEGETISPFEKEASSSEEGVSDTDDKPSSKENLEFTVESVDQILDEVRPYLISDGGNVSVQSVDPETKNVYLVLEGACGSCSSSTVTMQMGIERVLRENFEDLGEVIEVEDPNKAAEAEPQELTLEAVQAEINRIGPAISAMGGVCEILSVDPIGVVELEFRGPNKVQQGLELALRDVPFVKHVKFVN